MCGWTSLFAVDHVYVGGYVCVHQHIVNIEFLKEVVCGVMKFGI